MNPSSLPCVEFEFTLPNGLRDGEGAIHRHGVMRLATAKDELLAQRDRRTFDTPAYGVLVLLAASIQQLGDLTSVTPERLEGLFTSDLTYLREFYNRINQKGDPHIPVQCPHCAQPFEIELALSGESSATP